MRVAVWHNLPSGGGQRALYDQVRGLLARGHEVEVWSTPYADRSLLDLGQLAPYHVVPLYGSANAIYARVPGGPTLTAGYRLRQMRRHCAAVADEINGGSFDVVLCGSSAEFAATPLARYLRVPSVLYLQEPMRVFYEAAGTWVNHPFDDRRSSLARSLYEVLASNRRRLQASEERRNAAAFDVVLANSIYSIESVSRAYGITPRLCYLGIDTAAWPKPKATEWSRRASKVVGIGEIRPHKRVDFVVRALGALPAPRPSLQWIANSIDERYCRDVRAEAFHLGVPFEPLFRLPREKFSEVLSSAAVLAYAPWLEPFGYAPLEAAAAGTATVGVSEGGVRETVIDGVTGFLVPREERAMAFAIDRILRDERLGASLGMAARENVESRWNLEEAIERIEIELERARGGNDRTPSSDHR